MSALHAAAGWSEPSALAGLRGRQSPGLARAAAPAPSSSDLGAGDRPGTAGGTESESPGILKPSGV